MTALRDDADSCSTKSSLRILTMAPSFTKPGDSAIMSVTMTKSTKQSFAS